MRADVTVELSRARDGSVVAGGTLAVPPVWCRWDGTTLWLVGSAATPVADDALAFRLVVGEGVEVTVRSVAATMVYAARGAGTSTRTELVVGDGARLRWCPEPVVLTGRARHRATTVVDVAEGGTVCADEVVVLGRSGEEPGELCSTLELRVGGRLASLSSFDTSTPGWSGPAGVDGARVLATRVVHDAGGAPGGDGARVRDCAVVLHPEGGGAVAAALADDPRSATCHLDSVLGVDR